MIVTFTTLDRRAAALAAAEASYQDAASRDAGVYPTMHAMFAAHARLAPYVRRVTEARQALWEEQVRLSELGLGWQDR